MTHRRFPRWAFAAALALAAALAVSACGSSNSDDDNDTAVAPTAARADLAPVKDYLLDHTARLVRDTSTLQRDAEAYHALAEHADFDYAALLSARRAEVRQLVSKLQEDFHRANPSYEEMEGVVAGVPELADYDVIIDAGGDASDPAGARGARLTRSAPRCSRHRAR